MILQQYVVQFVEVVGAFLQQSYINVLSAAFRAELSPPAEASLRQSGAFDRHGSVKNIAADIRIDYKDKLIPIYDTEEEI